MEFTEYVREQRPTLLRFATVLTGQAWLADDLVSDVLGRAFERWDVIEGLDRPHAYVRRMIVNDYLSWRRRGRYGTPVADVPEAARSVEDHSARYAERDAMIARLQQLPPRQRAAVVLRYYAGLSDNEIQQNSAVEPALYAARSAELWRHYASPTNPKTTPPFSIWRSDEHPTHAARRICRTGTTRRQPIHCPR